MSNEHLFSHVHTSKYDRDMYLPVRYINILCTCIQRAEYIVYICISEGLNSYHIQVYLKGRVYSIHFLTYTCAICIYISAICI